MHLYEDRKSPELKKEIKQRSLNFKTGSYMLGTSLPFWTKCVEIPLRLFPKTSPVK